MWCNETIINRINSLFPSSTPLWGKMNVSQMLAHCNIGLKICFGEIKPRSNLLFKIFGKIFKRIIFSQKEFRKNSSTAREFIINHSFEFESEKKELISNIRRFVTEGNSCITTEPHVFFGKLSIEEWDTLMWKHLDHHLKQFNV